MAIFSDRLREALELRNMKPSVLSYKTGISESALSHYLKGDYEPKAKKLRLLAEALRVSESWLSGYAEKTAEIKDSPEDSTESGEDFIIFHRDGKTVKKRFSDEQMKMLVALIEAVPEKED